MRDAAKAMAQSVRNGTMRDTAKTVRRRKSADFGKL
jgi:hypothetical protein